MRIYQKYLEGANIYKCKRCNVHLARVDDLISKAFQGGTGKAYLFNEVVNIDLGPHLERDLMTGRHVTCDIVCRGCQQIIGWKYIVAFRPDQQYKEGKFIIEKEYLDKELAGQD